MRADRLLALLLTLQARGRMTARTLAETLEVSERTIYRDLDALSAAGVPVLAERGPGGGCALLEGYRTRLTGLTEPEVRALFVARLPGPVADLGMQRAAEAGLRKLEASLPAAQQHTLDQMRRRIHLDPVAWFQREEPVPHLGLVQEAVWRDRRVRVTYRREDGRASPRYLEPYGLVAKGPTWYLVAVAVDQARVYGVAHVRRARAQVQVYRVSRIQTATLTDEAFTRPDDFDLPAWWAGWAAAFAERLPAYTATVQLAPEAVPVLARLYGEGVYAQIAATPHVAGAPITLTLAFESADAACQQLLALGPDAEVLAPADLRRAVLDTAARLVSRYLADPAEAG